MEKPCICMEEFYVWGKGIQKRTFVVVVLCWDQRLSYGQIGKHAPWLQSEPYGEEGLGMEAEQVIPFFFLIFIYLFVLGLSCSTRDLCCGMRDLLVVTCKLSRSMHVGSSSPTRDWTWAPCIRSMESYPLDHEGSPIKLFLQGTLWNPGTRSEKPELSNNV